MGESSDGIPLAAHEEADELLVHIMPARKQ
jgi:hypothetical protein